ncbi:hypothetical protein AX15_002144 [Amanita polypyramis BW_CC]|nr:hypothetical protein AX15_002144 [Amanita polypyramis BW_CC]
MARAFTDIVPQPGNPKPRVFRLPEDEALINRYGFPSQGHAAVLGRLRGRIPNFLVGSETASLRPNTMLAINLGKNKSSLVDSIDDYVKGVHTFGPYSDVLVVNVSSPNTPGLRGLQNKDQLRRLLTGVTQARDELPISPITTQRPKLVLKIAPDLDESQIADIANVVRESRIDGVIVSNTTIQRPKNLNGREYATSRPYSFLSFSFLFFFLANKSEAGGLSGTPLKAVALQTLKLLRGQLPASVPIIGCGGIRSGADALEYAKAGACMVQVLTGFGYEGVGNCRRIKDELTEQLAKQKTTWQEVVKEAVEMLSAKELPKAAELKTIESAVGQLVAEAQELGTLLDRLGERMDRDSDTRR